MQMREFKIEEGSVHEKFLASTAKFQIFAGGFGNGKTATACVKAIKLITDYPGCNGLIARATFPKLNDTIRKEFKLWCPPNLIVSFPESKNSDNTAKFSNGSQINFRYIAQQGKMIEQTTSNLLSATYDFVIVDQMEDPEIVFKDFLDLNGRLRGSTIYRGLDPRMPKTGPRFFIMTANPTANWFFKQIIRPIQIYEATGKITDDLLCERDEFTNEPILVNDKPIMMIEVFEGSTYINKRNLAPDFLKTLQSTYRGQMKDRFLLGKWASYEGLVYPEFSEIDNVIPHKDMLDYMDSLSNRGYTFNWLEGYDFGIIVPSCYLLAFVCPMGAVHIVDGFYQPEMKIKDQAAAIKRIRASYGVDDDEIAYADPKIFARHQVAAKLVGASTADLFWNEGKIKFRRGNNDILNGILKVGAYLAAHPSTYHPYTGDSVSPLMFISDNLQFISDEFAAYMWQKDTNGKPLDKPVDKDDHAMDTIKYLMTNRPEIGQLLLNLNQKPKYLKWNEAADTENIRYARYGNR